MRACSLCPAGGCAPVADMCPPGRMRCDAQGPARGGGVAWSPRSSASAWWIGARSSASLARSASRATVRQTVACAHLCRVPVRLGCPWGAVGLLVVVGVVIGHGCGSGGGRTRQRTARGARRRVPKAGGDAPSDPPGLVMPCSLTVWGQRGSRGPHGNQSTLRPRRADCSLQTTRAGDGQEEKAARGVAVPGPLGLPAPAMPPQGAIST
jgi:hypothetical protein